MYFLNLLDTDRKKKLEKSPNIKKLNKTQRTHGSKKKWEEKWESFSNCMKMKTQHINYNMQLKQYLGELGIFNSQFKKIKTQ